MALLDNFKRRHKGLVILQDAIAMAEWRTVHRVGQRVLNAGAGGKADSPSDKVMSLRTVSKRFSLLGENFVTVSQAGI